MLFYRLMALLVKQNEGRKAFEVLQIVLIIRGTKHAGE